MSSQPKPPPVGPDTPRRKRRALCVAAVLMLSAAGGCGGGGGGGTAGDPGGDPGDPGGGGGGGGGVSVTISGKILYERVPHLGNGPLDYRAAFDAPVRGATVEAIAAASGAVLASTATDGAGDYAVTVPANTSVFIRTQARVADPTGRYDIRVVDNTRGQALYALDGSAASSGGADSVRNLTAPSGWGGNAYTGVRTAAPFAILDSIYAALLVLLSTDPDVALVPLTVNWSPNNVPVPGLRSDGRIGTTFYSAREIYVLGAEDNDTDEYDGHVLVHEFGHFLEDTLSRSDSTGGPHTTADRLDPRLAFSEGWGYAWAGIGLADPVTQDSLGPQQAFGFIIDVDENANANPGWYSEGSAQSILWDLFDAADDGVDSLALGFRPLYDILVGPQADTDAFATLFSFITLLKAARPADAAAIDAIVAGQSVQVAGLDAFGSSATNDAGSVDVLPVYTALTPGAAPVTLCSIVDFGEFNKLSNRRFLVLDVATSGRFDIRVTGPAGSDPDVVLHQRGVLAVSQSFADGVETLRTPLLSAGRYLVEVYEATNVFPEITPAGARGRTCLDVTAIAV